jgi:phosphatidylglycerol:prolipoprotein diacylglycerol transferase
MLPIIFELGGQRISLFGVLIGISMLVYLFSGWIYLRKEIEPNKIFDILFLGIISYLFFARLVGVLENFQYYINEPIQIFDLRDSNFSFVGLFIGFIISIILFNKRLIKQHQNKRSILEHIFLIFMLASIPFLIGTFISGRMPGIEVKSDIGVMFDDGIRRLPIGLFRLLFFILSIIIFQIIRKDKNMRLTNLIAGFFMGFAAFEVVINTFTKDYSPSIFGLMSSEQLIAIGVFILGTVILLGKKFSKIAYDEQDSKGRKTREELLSSNNPIDYSYSFKDMNYSINQNELSIKEKFRIFSNTIKRRLKK